MVKIHLDAGHGGSDSGACGNGLKEKDITLAVCLKVEELMRDYKDVEVYQTRTTDITQSLSQKSSIVNSKLNLDFCLSVHVNAGGGTGGEIWLQAAYGDAYTYAKTIISEYCSYTGATNRGTKIGDLHMNREVRCNSNLIELAFLDSPSGKDITLLKDIDKMAQGVVNGLVKCFKLTKKATTNTTTSVSSKTTNFINKIAPLAVADYKISGVLPSLTIAQAILESGWGTSELATKANNLFGIKADARWSGKIYNTQTKEYYSSTPTTISANFRSYDSFEGCIKDHSEFLRASRYAKVLSAKNYKVACEEVYKAGYATDPAYTSKLIKLIEDYKLYEYDKVATTTTNTSSSTTFSTAFKVGDKVRVKNTATNYATGENIASFVKGNVYTVKKVEKDRLLLSEISSFVYENSVELVSSAAFTSYKARVTTDVLNVRADATTNSKIVTTVKMNEVYTIVAEKNNWGFLKSQIGWICLDYTKKI